MHDGGLRLLRLADDVVYPLPGHRQPPSFGEPDPTEGLRRFESSLTRALRTLDADDLPGRWDVAAGLMDRVVSLGSSWGDADCGKVVTSVAALLNANREPEVRSASEEATGPPSATVAAACTALCQLLEALSVAAPATRPLAHRILKILLAAIFLGPPAQPEDGNAPLAGDSNTDLFGDFATAGLWCQRGAAAPEPQQPESGMLRDAKGRFLQTSGAATLIGEAVRAVGRAEPQNVCLFLADWFDLRCKERKMDLADTRVVLADGATGYLARQHLDDAEEQRAAYTGDLSALLVATNCFANFANVNSSGQVHRAGCLHRLEMYPMQKRLSFAFLEQLGREHPPQSGAPSWEYDPARDLLYHVPLLKLRASVTDWEHDEREIVLNAAVVERVAAEHIHKDTLYRSMFPSGSGPHAEELYGTAEFRVARRELFELEQSTRVTVCGPVTARFLSELARFTSDPDSAWYFSMFRAVPLKNIGGPEEVTQLRRQLSDQADMWLREIQRVDEARNHVQRIFDCSPPADRPKVIDRLSVRDEEYHQHRLWRDECRAKLEQLQRPEVGKIGQRFKTWLQAVLRAPRDFGYESRSKAHQTADQSLAELATNLCLSQRGHFFVHGSGAASNVLCPRPAQPVTFLSATGLDFNTASTTQLEGRKYFRALRAGGSSSDLHTVPATWKGFQSKQTEDALLERIKLTYISIFSACQAHGVRNASMLSMGCGAFLRNVDPSDRTKVRGLYFQAQFELLAEKDWGFECYYLNAAVYNQEAREAFEAGLRSGRYNDPHRGRTLRCSVVIHSRDAKFLAVELAKRSMNAAVLNPSDCATLVLGVVGNHWESGRCGYYGGEEDFMATGTGLLAHRGLSDVLINPGRIHNVDWTTQRMAQSAYTETSSPSFPGMEMTSPSPARMLSSKAGSFHSMALGGARPSNAMLGRSRRQMKIGATAVMLPSAVASVGQRFRADPAAAAPISPRSRR